MKTGNEYLTGNLPLRYPFCDDSVLYRADASSSSSDLGEILDDTLARRVFGCFADAFIQATRPFVEIQPQIRGLHIDRTTHTLRFVLFDGNNLAHEPTTLYCTRSTTIFPIIHGKSSWCWYSITLSSSGIRELEDVATDIGDIQGTTLSFSLHCRGKVMPCVTSVAIYGGSGKNEDGTRYTRLEALQHDPDVRLHSSFGIRPGYNMEFSGFETLSTGTDIRLNAIPGAGQGVAPCGCDTSKITFKTPGLLSKDGHVRLFNDTCYDLVPMLNSSASGELQMNVKCKACCLCEMYVSLVNDRLVPLSESIRSIKSELDATRTSYEDNVAKWNTRLQSVYPEDIITTLTGTVLDAAGTNLKGSSVKGTMDRCAFILTLRNEAFISAKLQINSFSSNGVARGAQLSYTDGYGTAIHKTVSMTSLQDILLLPGHTALLTYYIRLKNKTTTDHQTGFISRMTINIDDANNKCIDRRTLNLTI